jgi:RND family efflux transporter MFP subunit
MKQGLLLWGLAASAAMNACGDPEAKPVPAALPAARTELVAVDTLTVQAPLSLAALLQVEHDAIVYARSGGIVESVYVDLGRTVTAGTLLARLEHQDQDIALDGALEGKADTVQSLARARELARSGAGSVAEVEHLEYAVRRTDLAIRQARRNQEFTRITAPFDGVVTSRLIRVGQLVRPGDSLFRVTATAPLLASVRVPEGSGGRLAVGDGAEVTGIDGHSERGRVVRLSPAIDPASGTREVVLQLEGRSRFVPGASVTVRLGADRRRVIAIPASAVTQPGYVTVWENGRTTLRPVTLGDTLPGGRVEVLAGVARGDRLVRNPP